MNEPSEDNQALILALETATRTGGVALACGEDVVAAESGNAAVSHSTNLIEMIEQVLGQANRRLTEIDLFAVAVGPGSFTGLRIGLATVKAFATHLGKRIAPVSTLAAVAHASQVKGELVSLLPAGRGEVFAQQFLARDGEIIELDRAQHLSPRAVLDRYPAPMPLIFAGEPRMAEASFGVPFSFGTSTPHLLTEASIPKRVAVLEKALAPAIAVLGYGALRNGKSIAPEDLRAAYVRASDAEINERWQQLKAQPQG